MSTILIKNVQLIDGTGRQAVKADVLVKNEKISAMGRFPYYKADEIIDGMGAYLAPGFIDVGANSDRYLSIFSEPSQKDFLLQGVTTIIGGEGGLSLAPIFYGSLSSIDNWANINGVNVNWHSIKELLNTFSHRKIGVNFGTLVGYNTVRQDLTSKEINRALTPNEFSILNFIVEQALNEGAFGISIGLDNVYGRGFSYAEIKFLAEISTRNNTLFSINLRDEKEKLIDSINEILNLVKETGSRTIINNFRPFLNYERDYEKSVKILTDNAANADIHFNLYPFDYDIEPLISFLPKWAQDVNVEKTLKNIKSKVNRRKFLTDKIFKMNMELLVTNVNKVFIYAPTQNHLNGKTLAEFCDNRKLDVISGIFVLMEEIKFKAALAYQDINFKEIASIFGNDRAFVASSGGFSEDDKLNKIMEVENYSSMAFKKFLELIEKEKILPIETAIYKITGLPAQKINLKNRGLIRDGYYADLVLFRDSEIREVIVNGKRVVKDGEFQGILAGSVLKRQQK